MRGITRRLLGSVRGRITLTAAAVVAVALVTGALGLLFTLQRSLVRADDGLARSRVRDVAVLAAAGGLARELTASGDDVLVQVVDASREVIAGTSNVRGAQPITGFVPQDSQPSVLTVRDFAADPGDRESYRVWTVRVDTPGGPVSVYAATSLESVGETLATLRRVLAVGLPLLLAVLVAITWFLVGRALRPVETIRAEVADISGRALDRRVATPSGSDEITRLALTMNAMLDRLESASARQRAFVADASHELQSPLASMRAQLEVGMAHPTDADWPRTAADLLEESRELERLVRDLLFLAREDEARIVAPTESVDLDDIVLEEVARLRAATALRLDTSRVSAAPMHGHQRDLVRLARNLLENAERHATSFVRVELSERGGTIDFVVEDDGPGVPGEQRARVFERFARLDGDRSRDAGGTGLGLAIVKSIAERHAGTVCLEQRSSGARFVVRLPSTARPSR